MFRSRRFTGEGTKAVSYTHLDVYKRQVQSYEKLFAQRQLAEFGEKQKKEFAEKRRELDKSKLRVREIDGIIQKLYEDKAMGDVYKSQVLSNKNFPITHFN